MKTEKNILIAFLLNISFSIFELIGGFFTNSISILSDAFHDFCDALSIGISYFLEKKSRRVPNDKYTYGYLRYSILGAFITTTILIGGSIFVTYSGVLRIINPVKVNHDGMIVFAIIGVVVNLLAAYVTREKDSVNQKAVNLHMLEDVLGWVVVLVGSLLIKFFDISIIDALMSIGVSVFIFVHAIKNLKEIVDLFLEKVPTGINVEDVKRHLLEIDGVIDVHHLHVWSMDSLNNYATMHVVVSHDDLVKIKHDIREELMEHGISHVTIEVEDKDEECSLKECSVSVSSTKKHHQHHHH